MTYYTLSAPCTATLEIKKSQFLGFGYPIDSREQLMFHVEQLRHQYPDARHVCYGYIIGDPRNTTSATTIARVLDFLPIAYPASSSEPSNRTTTSQTLR